MWNPSKCGCECDKACKIGEYFDIKNCACGKHLFTKLILACEDETLNTTKATSTVDKKVIHEKIIALFTLIDL